MMFIESKNLSSATQKKQFRQLAIVDYNCKAKSSHLLVRSTSPENAEDSALEFPIKLKDITFTDKTDAGIREFRNSLKNFLQSKQINSLNEKLNLQIILNIHGYSTSLASFWNNSYQRNEQQFLDEKQEKKFDIKENDYVLFIDYSWPSEEGNSPSMKSIISAMPFLMRFICDIFLIYLITHIIIKLLFGTLYITKLAYLNQWFCIITNIFHLNCVEVNSFSGSFLSCFFGALIGIPVALMLMRKATYFRDRERASSAGVYDAVQLVTWLQIIYNEELKKYNFDPETNKVELNILAHSMGCYVATNLVRILSDVFDPAAVSRWKNIPDGPFSNKEYINNDKNSDKSVSLPKGIIGKIFKLGRLVLVSPDISVWALINGRQNALQASLRRFDEVYVFTNDFDMILRQFSKVANYFIWPSKTNVGGYRLGNVVNLEKISREKKIIIDDAKRESTGRWRVQKQSFEMIGINRTRNGNNNDGNIKLSGPPFNAVNYQGQNLTIVDCTDYIDRRLIFRNHRILVTKTIEPRLAAKWSKFRSLRYIKTIILHLFLQKLDSHGGYFEGPFCLELIYRILSSHDNIEESDMDLNTRLKQHQICFIKVRCPGVSTL